MQAIKHHLPYAAGCAQRGPSDHLVADGCKRNPASGETGADLTPFDGAGNCATKVDGGADGQQGNNTEGNNLTRTLRKNSNSLGSVKPISQKGTTMGCAKKSTLPDADGQNPNPKKGGSKKPEVPSAKKGIITKSNHWAALGDDSSDDDDNDDDSDDDSDKHEKGKPIDGSATSSNGVAESDDESESGWETVKTLSKEEKKKLAEDRRKRREEEEALAAAKAAQLAAEEAAKNAAELAKTLERRAEDMKRLAAFKQRVDAANVREQEQHAPKKPVKKEKSSLALDGVIVDPDTKETHGSVKALPNAVREAVKAVLYRSKEDQARGIAYVTGLCENHFPLLLHQRHQAAKYQKIVNTPWWDHDAIAETMRKYARKMALKFLKTLNKNVSLRSKQRRNEDILARLEARTDAKLLGKSSDKFVSKELKEKFVHESRPHYPTMPTNDEDAMTRIREKAADFVIGIVPENDYSGTDDYKAYRCALHKKHQHQLKIAREKKERRVKRNQKKSKKPKSDAQENIDALKNKRRVQRSFLRTLHEQKKNADGKVAKNADGDEQKTPSKWTILRYKGALGKSRSNMDQLKKERAASKNNNHKERNLLPDEEIDGKRP